MLKRQQGLLMLLPPLKNDPKTPQGLHGHVVPAADSLQVDYNQNNSKGRGPQGCPSLPPQLKMGHLSSRIFVHSTSPSRAKTSMGTSDSDSISLPESLTGKDLRLDSQFKLKDLRPELCEQYLFVNSCLYIQDFAVKPKKVFSYDFATVSLVRN